MKSLSTLEWALVISLICFVTLLLAGSGQPGPHPIGWWCESRYGLCYETREQCSDESCYWKRGVWETRYDRRRSVTRLATESLCERYRLNVRSASSKCERVYGKKKEE